MSVYVLAYLYVFACLYMSNRSTLLSLKFVSDGMFVVPQIPSHSDFGQVSPEILASISIIFLPAAKLYL